jgi:hypothetical protein
VTLKNWYGDFSVTKPTMKVFTRKRTMTQFEQQPDDFYFGEEQEDNRVGVTLQESERSLLDAATRILAAKITVGDQAAESVSADDIKDSVTTAIKMARMIDKAVRADKEK